MASHFKFPSRPLPAIWAHRGASAEFPENTLAAFRAAIAEGSEGIESDVHTTLDERLLLFHDPSLDRTTDRQGLIAEKKWEGDIENARTTQAPQQAIPLFEELLDLLMEPHARHVRFNIDVKVFNKPEQLFRLMATKIRRYPDWQTALAPRLVLGLWHPAFVKPARELLPGLTYHHITAALPLSLDYMWPHVSGFSVAFPFLLTSEGAAFRERCQRDGKEFGVWTVNEPAEMCVAAAWGAGWILTDKPALWRSLREEMEADREGTYHEHVRPWFAWSSYRYSSLALSLWSTLLLKRLQKFGGPFAQVALDDGKAAVVA